MDLGTLSSESAVPFRFDAAISNLLKQKAGHATQLALSAGGQYGAFGAGFLKAWSHSEPGPPKFDVVTGVSTGAMMVTHAFLGRYDDLADKYEALSDDKIFRRRPIYTLPWSSSLLDTKPLRAYLDHEVTDTLIAEVETQAKLGRKLFVLAVNLTTGRPQILPLSEVALSKCKDKRQIYIDYIMASAAIPLGFTPVALRGGAVKFGVEDGVYVDGGARLHLFFLEEVKKQAALRGMRHVGDLYIIVNNDFYLPQKRTPKNILDIGGRSFGVITDQLARDSLYQLITAAPGTGWSPNFVAARHKDRGHPCAPLDSSAAFDTFCPGLQKCLSRYGAELAKQDKRWKTTPDDIPGFDANTVAALTCEKYPQ